MNKYFMKAILLLLLTTSIVSAQSKKVQTSEDDKKSESYSNFKVEEEAVIWQKVYEIPVSVVDYEKFIKLKACLDNIETKDNLLIGRLRSFKLNFNGFKDGLFDSEIPLYMKATVVTGDVKIELKEQKYRVTIYNIKFTGDSPNNELWPTTKADNLEMYYFKPFGKKVKRANFVKIDERIFDKNFDGFFTYKIDSSDF